LAAYGSLTVEATNTIPLMDPWLASRNIEIVLMKPASQANLLVKDIICGPSLHRREFLFTPSFP
jgi:hypothetical protein